MADTGLNLKHAATGDDKYPTFTLQTGDTDIAVNDKLGVINFQAPDEGTGTDAILVAAGIEAVSEGNFAADNNATKLSFKTAAGEAATEKMSLSSGGNLTISGDLTISGGNITNAITCDSTLGVTGAATLASLICTAGATFGGGYGSTGTTISTAGVIQTDGALTCGGITPATADGADLGMSLIHI